MSKKAVIIVDMIHDFVYGKFGSKQAQSIVPKIKELLKRARESGALIVYTRDVHERNDPELAIWGEHAMKGTKGCEIIDELSPEEGDIIVEKRTYDSFYNTKLERILRERDVKDVYIVGVATDICVLHTAFGAFARGFNVHIVEDCVASISEEGHKWAIEYMSKIYGAKIIRSEELFQ
ncbi:MAG TPA: cysteine hydrolase [Thermoprotei archaeon]|nr:cysteine hydrolase [Thermoprotei archaeon]